MKAVAIIAVLLVLAANAVALLPAVRTYLSVVPFDVVLPLASAYQTHLLVGAVVLGSLALIAIAAIRAPRREPVRVVAEAARPAPVAPPANRVEAEIVGFLATLQAKGRLVDFLMDDINGFDDAQVGAAARVVHTGCKAALQEHFRISPVRTESEGAKVEVPAGYAADEYRLLGKISGQAPFSGVLVHHGWKTDQVKLPRILRDSADRLPTIAPAEVELK